MFDNLDPAVVKKNLELHKQILIENQSTLAVAGGQFHDTVLYYSALFATENQQQVEDVINLTRVGDILARPAGVSRAAADAVAELKGYTRKVGDHASGHVLVTCSTSNGFLLAKNTVFSTGQQLYRTARNYMIRLIDGKPQVGERALVKSGNVWSTTIPVVAIKSGADGNIRKHTMFKPDNGKHIKTVVAADNFTGGRDEETNSELIQRIKRGDVTPMLSSRWHIDSFLAKKFDIRRTLIAGAGSAHMKRDDGLGGCIDIYVWPCASVQLNTSVHKMQGVRQEDGRWLIVIPRHIAAGCYTVSVTCNNTLCNSQISRHIDTTHFPLRIKNAAATIYSALQSMDVLVEHQGDNDMFDVEVYGMPDIWLVQQALADKRLLPIGSDILVLAPLPTMLNELPFDQ